MERNFYNSKKGFIALIFSLCCAFSAQAQATWTGLAGDGDWNNLTNWDVLYVPGASTDVAIPASTLRFDAMGNLLDSIATVITLPASLTITVNKLNVSANDVHQAKLTIPATTTLNVIQNTVSGTAILALIGGVIENNGMLNVTSGAGVTGVGITLRNSGTNGNPTPQTFDAKLINNGTLNINTAVAGGGNCMDSQVSAAGKKGVFTANGTITLTPPSSANKYAISTTASANLLIDGAGFTLPTGTFGFINNGSGGNITIESGTTITVNATSGGTMSGIYYQAATSSLTNKGTLNLNGTYQYGLRLAGTTSVFNNSGVLNLNGTYSSGAFVVEGNATHTITNSGTIDINNAHTTGAGVSISAAPTLTFTNSGTFNAVANGNFSVGDGSTVINNTGTITTNKPLVGAAGTGNSTINNGGTLAINISPAAASQTATSANLNIINSYNGTGGRFEGRGNLSSVSFNNSNGTIAPKGSATFPNAGAFNLNASGVTAYTLTGTFEAQINAATGSGTSNDGISCATTASIDISGMTLKLTAVGYTPANNDIVPLVIAGTSLIGTFSSVTLPTNWAADYNSTRANVKFTTTIPVELVDFTANPLSKVNKLAWITATELNNKGFDIQRSPQPPKGAFDKWETIGFVKAEGKAATYNFVDNTPLSISYYRLRQVDFDGTETLSKVVSVSQFKGSKVAVYPNPVSDKLNLSISDDIDETQQTNIVLYDLIGRKILQQTTVSKTTELDLSTLAKGVYLLDIQSKTTVLQQKIIKQ